MSTERKIEAARFRARLARRIRDYFGAQDVLEVETPALSAGILTDCNTGVFTARYHSGGHTEGAADATSYLQTSPELPMKRLLCEGYPDIFQICKAFRNGESGSLHNPEFSMLEWYRKGFSLERIMDETAALCALAMGPRQILVMRYRDLFIELAGVDPAAADPAELDATCRARGATPPALCTVDEYLDFIMAEIVQPSMQKDCLFFVAGFPLSQAMLAAPDPADSSAARRFELFYNGIELANGYEELGDPVEAESRMKLDNALRVRSGRPVLPIDSRFIRALRKGLPKCSGVALGLDRLIMAAMGYRTVGDTLTFGWDQA